MSKIPEKIYESISSLSKEEIDALINYLGGRQSVRARSFAQLEIASRLRIFSDQLLELRKAEPSEQSRQIFDNGILALRGEVVTLQGEISSLRDVIRNGDRKIIREVVEATINDNISTARLISELDQFKKENETRIKEIFDVFEGRICEIETNNKTIIENSIRVTSDEIRSKFDHIKRIASWARKALWAKALLPAIVAVLNGFFVSNVIVSFAENEEIRPFLFGAITTLSFPFFMMFLYYLFDALKGISPKSIYATAFVLGLLVLLYGAIAIVISMIFFQIS